MQQAADVLLVSSQDGGLLHVGIALHENCKSLPLIATLELCAGVIARFVSASSRYSADSAEEDEAFVGAKSLPGSLRAFSVKSVPALISLIISLRGLEDFLYDSSCC